LPFQASSNIVGANESMRFGVIGCKGMGFSNLRSLVKIDGVDCVALCDVDKSVLDGRSKDVQELTSTKVKQYGDYRKMLENKDLDFVVIGTPDHWHCLMLSDALEAGKHVYCEKPLANSIEEIFVMEEAVKKYKKTVQIGQWQRSGPHWQSAMDYVKSGVLGNIRTVKAWAYQGWMKPVPVYPDKPVPEGVNYDMWLGPAPARPFNQNRFHFNFRWFWDYAGGLMTDWGVHIIDMALNGMDAKVPKSVMATGGKFAYPDDASETPDTLQAVFEYDGFTMLWEHATGIDLGPYQKTHGVAFIGNNGTLVVNRQGWEVLSERNGDQMKIEVPQPTRVQGSDLDRHTNNFIDCIKTGNEPNASIKVGATAALNAHMGNVAFKTGNRVYWDDQKREFTDKEANKHTGVTYRGPWKLPS